MRPPSSSASPSISSASAAPVAEIRLLRDPHHLPREVGRRVVTLWPGEVILGETQVSVVHDRLHVGAHPHRLRELLSELLTPPPLAHRDLPRGSQQLLRAHGLDRRRELSRAPPPPHAPPPRSRPLLQLPYEGPREQRALAHRCRRLRALERENLFVECDGRGIRPNTEMIAERLAQPLEAPDRLSTLSGIEIDHASARASPCSSMGSSSASRARSAPARSTSM